MAAEEDRQHERTGRCRSTVRAPGDSKKVVSGDIAPRGEPRFYPLLHSTLETDEETVEHSTARERLPDVPKTPARSTSSSHDDRPRFSAGLPGGAAVGALRRHAPSGVPPGISFRAWVRQQVENEEYFFHSIELPGGLTTPGWSDPRTEKLPHFHLPEDLTGKRVLDVGCAEGFFSFEAERRGASEVVAIDSYPESIRRFNICRAALGSRVEAYLVNVYDLTPRAFGTFDLILFYGVLYHLRYPLLALERLLSVCSGSMLLQTATHEEAGSADRALARFHSPCYASGSDEAPRVDPTVFWMPNRECARAMVSRAGFCDVVLLSPEDLGFLVLSAKVRSPARGEAPDFRTAPWS